MGREIALPKKTLSVVDTYLGLPMAGKKIRCPYYKNDGKRKIKFGERIAIGKGHPQEIISAVQFLAEKSNIKLEDLNTREIKEFMKKKGVGVDCSGFVNWILDYWHQEKFNGEHIWRKIKFPLSFLKKIRYFLRPIENLDVNTLLSSQDCKPVFGLAGIEPGDLIHLGRDHLLIVYKVGKDAKGRTKTIFYCHSSDFYDGVHKGEIEVIDPNGGLERQRWIEGGENINWSFEEYLKSPKSGVSRLEIFEKNG